MSRSFRKHWSSQWACGEDKPFRQSYNRSCRRKNNRIVRECEIYYRDLDRIFHPYEEMSSCYGDICHVDEWVSSPEYLVDNEPEHQPNPDMNTCIGCCWSENCWDWNNHKFVDMWDEAPDEKFCKNRIDYSVKYSDKWSWPSDGGTFYEGDINSLRRELNEELFAGRSNHRWCDKTIWDDYCEYRDAKVNSNSERTWMVTYLIPTGIEFELDFWNSHKRYENGMKVPKDDEKYHWAVEPAVWDRTFLYLNCYRKVTVGEEVKKELKHRPHTGDIPKKAINISVWRPNKRNHSQARGDGDLMSFLFYRNIIPTTFKSREEMTSWILKHEEEIVKKWYKLKIRSR